MLVHGSVTAARRTWGSLPATLGARFAVEAPDRPGFTPDTAGRRVDFDEHAAWLVERMPPGAHLVGHSYGGVVCLLAAARVPELAGSLTVIEPPCTRVALDDPAVAEFARAGAALWAHGPRDDPDAFLRAFFAAIGSPFAPATPLPPDLEHGARVLVAERGPWEADVPLDALAAARIPTLVVSGAHHAAFTGICDVLERALGAERADLPGFGHSPHRHPRFAPLLEAHVDRAALPARAREVPE